MKHLILAALIILALAVGACSKNPSKPTTPGAIQGTVVDTLSGLIPGTLAGAAVTTDPATDSVTTDGNGRFFIGGVVEGYYAVRVVKDGYFGIQASVPVLAGDTTKVTIYARPRPWLTATAMPDARHNFATALVASEVYILAGIGVAGGGTTRYSSMFRYRPSANAWDPNGWPQLAIHRESPACAVVNTMIYVFGGSIGTKDTSLVEICDQVVCEPRASLPTPCRAMAAVTVGDSVFLFGGFIGTAATDSVRVYKPSADTLGGTPWRTAANMPAPRGGLSAVVVNGLAYVFGGNDGSGDRTESYEYNPANNTWSAKASMSAGRSYMACAAVNSQVYLFGGRAGTAAQATVYRYTPATNSYAMMDSLPIARFGAGAVAANNRIYIFGGFDSANSLASVEVYNILADVK